MTMIAGSRALGFGVFAVAAWLLSMLAAGFVSTAGGFGGGASPVAALGVFAGVGLLVAGVAAFLRREGWLGFFFIFWAAAAWAFGSMMASGWLWFALAFVNLYLWLAASRAGQEAAIGAVAFLIGIDAVGQGLHGVLGLNLAGQIGAYFGLAAALMAFYVSATSVMCPEGCERLPMMGRTHRESDTTVV